MVDLFTVCFDFSFLGSATTLAGDPEKGITIEVGYGTESDIMYSSTFNLHLKYHLGFVLLGKILKTVGFEDSEFVCD